MFSDKNRARSPAEKCKERKEMKSERNDEKKERTLKVLRTTETSLTSKPYRAGATLECQLHSPTPNKVASKKE